jgi:hypothetical protein
MSIRIFRSASRPGLFAFAEDETQLPAQFGPWLVEGAGAMPVGAVPNYIAVAIRNQGYYLSAEGTNR